MNNKQKLFLSFSILFLKTKSQKREKQHLKNSNANPLLANAKYFLYQLSLFCTLVCSCSCIRVHTMQEHVVVHCFQMIHTQNEHSLLSKTWWIYYQHDEYLVSHSHCNLQTWTTFSLFISLWWKRLTYKNFKILKNVLLRIQQVKIDV